MGIKEKIKKRELFVKKVLFFVLIKSNAEVKDFKSWKLFVPATSKVKRK
jgi:hypothetical protein